MPIVSSIRTSVENKDILVLDAHAKSGSFCRGRQNQLLAYTGGFSIVFPYIVNGEKWAFRCWHTEMGDVRQRIETIAKAIQESGADYLCDFTYVDKGIIVEGKVYPTTRMRWIDGVTIKDYICRNNSDKIALEALADKFMAMVQDMHKRGFAHGDLQHGNIIVDNAGRLFLVDYDSFYCKELKGEPDIITGLKDYQHPLRQSNKVTSPKLDYFSELIIYLSIVGIAANPYLVDEFKVEDADHLLFEAADYIDLHNSKIYQKLHNVSYEIDLLLQILEIYLSKTKLDDLEPFDILLDKLSKEPQIQTFISSCGNVCLQGDKIELRWAVLDYTKVLLNGIDVTCQNSITQQATSHDNTFTLRVQNGRKETSQSLSVRGYAKPHIAITADKTKLHQHKTEPVTLTWGVQNAHKISLLQDGKTINESCTADESYTFQAKSTTTFTIRVIALDTRAIFDESLCIYVYPDATIEFHSDKEYVFPTIPFTLYWNTQNAKEVKLNGKVIPPQGTLVVADGVAEETRYSLCVVDDFGTKEEIVTIKMLPIPRVETLVIPIPNLERKVEVAVNAPTQYIELEMPTITIHSKNIIPNEMYNFQVETNAVRQLPPILLKVPDSKFSLWNRITQLINKKLYK